MLREILIVKMVFRHIIEETFGVICVVRVFSPHPIYIAQILIDNAIFHGNFKYGSISLTSCTYFVKKPLTQI